MEGGAPPARSPIVPLVRTVGFETKRGEHAEGTAVPPGASSVPPAVTGALPAYAGTGGSPSPVMIPPGFGQQEQYDAGTSAGFVVEQRRDSLVEAATADPTSVVTDSLPPLPVPSLPYSPSRAVDYQPTLPVPMVNATLQHGQMFEMSPATGGSGLSSEVAAPVAGTQAGIALGGAPPHLSVGTAPPPVPLAVQTTVAPAPTAPFHTSPRHDVGVSGSIAASSAASTSSSMVQSVAESVDASAPPSLTQEMSAPQHAAAGKGADGAQQEQEQRRGPPKEPKPKMTKAERRALQEAQRAAKAAAKAEGGGGGGGSGAQQSKGGGSKDAESAKDASGGKKAPSKPTAADTAQPDSRAPAQQRPAAVMQYDDKKRVKQQAKKALVERKATSKAVELFAHLPQYDREALQESLQETGFNNPALHPSIVQLGLCYADGTLRGGRARCLALLETLRIVIDEFTTPPDRNFAKDLTARINTLVQFLIDCRPLSISMGNAIKSLKTTAARLGHEHATMAEAKAELLEHIDRFIQERILLAGKVIVDHAVSKIRDGDVVLTFGYSAVVDAVLEEAFSQGRHFRVIIIDCRPLHEGRKALQRFMKMGITCTYALLGGASHAMHEATKVFLGAAAVLSNGTVLSRAGQASVAMCAKAAGVPVLICCETCKFHERVQLDAITFNELGDPESLVQEEGQQSGTALEGWRDVDQLQLLNLVYDVTPAEFVTMIISEGGMLPPSSVPVVLREAAPAV